ncbi:MAG TPA: serine hydrolase, partial [Hyphomonas sp.]|nr:serine hydrolase [Hyphomonas sp.]
MRSVRSVFASTAALALVALPSLAQEGGNTNLMDKSLAAGWKASFVCSDTFVAHMTLDEIRDNDLDGIYTDFQRDFDRLPEARVDLREKTVTVQYDPTMPPRIAAYRPGFGCTQLPAGADETMIDYLPRFAAWPEVTGEDRGSAIGSNVKVSLRTEEAERLDAPVSFAFDER